MEEEKALQLKLKQERKNQERIAIKAIITAKKARLGTTRQNSTSTLNELAEAMYQQSNSILPGALEGALQGNSATSAKQSLTQLAKPTFKTPVKEV
ncbi:hypothetical protein [Enterococcus termitis]|uniref:Uncharacterized protein n=1 Tax=Enterococcus termitis TaxID=332950 RepID=A0A1E5GAY1_9ENTE|nr:hypothetical protein [Enterococcus termitis]OEG09765.1 hypothetical protein BCR25_09655 [Enterococcus termitis]OJG96893.1 hypothetical protein RV18_GL001731 [Enterococcus termitis]